MPPLREIQRDFSQALLGGSDQAIAGRVLHDRLAPAQRIQIYRNHVRITLGEALATTFPVVARLVGGAYFASAARRFIEREPPRSPVLAEYGAAFPDFLAGAPNAPAYLPDVARLEWALNLAYHAEDRPALEPRQLASLPPEAQAALRLKPLPSTAIVSSAFPILAIWQANQPGRADTVDLAQGGQTVLVWREDGDAVCRALGPGEAVLLQALGAGRGLGEAASAAVQAEPGLDLPPAIAALLATAVFSAS
ncbi:MAG: putative DNA-binding domain-containing protein [Alphaproteobacteria bacterium]|nr:putative DNA-binding domain-containing protein [Alphaproteobacteria bacterium]